MFVHTVRAVSVSEHLAIDLDEYDSRIRTFIPDYEEMLDTAATAANAINPRVVVDLGIGTGALASRVLKRRGVRVVGIDEDARILEVARRRLGARRASFLSGNFLSVQLPQCDAMVASFALHHVASARFKQQFFARARTALRRGGVLVSADCHPSALPERARAGRELWLQHLAGVYGRREAARYLRTWAREDSYTTLEQELRLLSAAGFTTDVIWRRDSFAVLVAAR